MWHVIQFCCCSNYATVSHTGMQIFNFVVLSVIIAHHLVLTPHSVHELELNCCSKTSHWKWETPLRVCGGGGSRNPLAKPWDLLNGTPCLYRGVRLRNTVQYKEDFCQWCMSWNEFKRAPMSLIKLKRAWMSLNQS